MNIPLTYHLPRFSFKKEKKEKSKKNWNQRGKRSRQKYLTIHLVKNHCFRKLAICYSSEVDRKNGIQKAIFPHDRCPKTDAVYTCYFMFMFIHFIKKKPKHIAHNRNREQWVSFSRSRKHYSHTDCYHVPQFFITIHSMKQEIGFRIPLPKKVFIFTLMGNEIEHVWITEKEARSNV